MHIKLANYAIEDLLRDFKPNLMPLNEMIYTTSSVISPVIFTRKQNSCKQLKWKLKIQKEIEEYSGEKSILNEMTKGVKVKTRKAKKHIYIYI